MPKMPKMPTESADDYFPLERKVLDMHKFKHVLYPQISYFGSPHAYLTVGQANLTVKRGCSHCEQCREVERSVTVSGGGSSRAPIPILFRKGCASHAFTLGRNVWGSMRCMAWVPKPALAGLGAKHHIKMSSLYLPQVSLLSLFACRRKQRSYSRHASAFDILEQYLSGSGGPHETASFLILRLKRGLRLLFLWLWVWRPLRLWLLLRLRSVSVSESESELEVEE